MAQHHNRRTVTFAIIMVTLLAALFGVGGISAYGPASAAASTLASIDKDGQAVA